jgi:hypothetical protein
MSSKLSPHFRSFVTPSLSLDKKLIVLRPRLHKYESPIKKYNILVKLIFSTMPLEGLCVIYEESRNQEYIRRKYYLPHFTVGYNLVVVSLLNSSYTQKIDPWTQ